ncbi:uncharacterized protein EV420DRAFT_714535 [Desarmillaria tabescens]|uniref:Uncharacterized protein n=1 Tax=Armillaria tabescens TaxID=1929756 RepID=A0AA39JYW8_ARMTA|nr:uncharacterized protein EV420DRAFT_714535 [Desarmillaria tabescens]KAK0451379.1 hypothetical protein EV420DRAFT_714535 [Desarmillaria tabescens]
MAAPSHRAQDIYPSAMLFQGHGYPLWHPAPPSNFPPDYVRRGTQIGDLGYLNDTGGFIYLFNVYKDAEDPVNLKRVPLGFVPLKSDSGVREELEFHAKNSMISMSRVESQRSAGPFFKSTSSITHGPLLVLPDGAERYNSENPGLLGEYAAANAHSWYEYLNGQGRGIRNGTLYLVTGCDKCCSWTIQCYAQSSNTSKFILGGARREMHTASGVHQRSRQRDMRPGATANQTIFLRGYSISVRDRPMLCVFKGIRKDTPTIMMRILALLPRTKPEEIPYDNRSTHEVDTSVQQFPDVYPSLLVNGHILDTVSHYVVRAHLSSPQLP